MRFTDRSIAALKPKAERYEVWEDGCTGMGCRVSPKGRKSWVYMYRFNGKARRMGLGTYPAIGLAKARVMHAGAREILAKGADPGAHQTERKRAEPNAETVLDLADAYLEAWAAHLEGILSGKPRAENAVILAMAGAMAGDAR